MPKPQGTCLIIELSKAFIHLFRFTVEIEGTKYIALTYSEVEVGQGYLRCNQMELRLYSLEMNEYFGTLLLELGNEVVIYATLQLDESKIVFHTATDQKDVLGEHLVQKIPLFAGLGKLNSEFAYSFIPKETK